MVFVFKIVILCEKRFNLVSVVVGTQTSLRGPEVVDTGRDPHVGQSVRSLHGMLHELEERGLLGGRDRVVEAGGEIAQALEVLQYGIGPEMAISKTTRVE